MKQTVLTTAIVVLALAGLARADGTIQLQNGALTRVWYCGGVTPFAGAFNFGVFVISSNGTQTLLLPLGTNTAQGLIAAPNPFPIPGTTAGQVVSLQVMGWQSQFGTNWRAAFSGNYAVTPVCQVTLGPASGPGTQIWMSATGTDPNRFWPLQFCSLAGPKFFLENRKVVAEGTNGEVHVTFWVGLEYRSDPPTNYPKLVNFSTRSGSAVAGQDFVPTNGTLSFAYGESVQTITVTLTADSTPEPDEQFTVELSNPLYAAIVGRSGTCLITEAHVKVNVGDADAAVTFHTVAGRHYAVEFSPDLATWAVVEGAGDVTGVGGAMIIYDRGVGRSGARYYRTRILAP